MKRTRRESLLKPVKQIEVSEKHVALRIVLFVLAILIAIGAFAYALIALLRVPKGWTVIEVNAQEVNCAADMTFYYYIGEEGRNARAEKKAVVQAYSQACVNAYKIFDTSADSGSNVCAVNRNVNKTVKVDSALYQALKSVVDYDAKLILTAPVYERRAGLFYSADDDEAKIFDPNFSEEEREFYSDVLTFVNNAEDVSLALLDDNTVKLNVSQRYLDFARENDVSVFLDFFHLKNAFIVDYIVEYLTSAGFKAGFISSVDGFVRTLSGQRASNTVMLFDNMDGSPYACASVTFNQSISAVNLHSFKINADEKYYYRYSNGDAVNPYVNANGQSVTCASFIFGYSAEAKCSQILFELLPVFTAERLDEAQLKSLTEKNVYCVYSKDKKVFYSEDGLNMSVNRSDEEHSYEKQLLK